ncbi:MAG: FKBP-type peptidyl-prolyl cis-trans isomerase [Bacteroidota bacterium]|nr:FKBP-type peptidyl-prolyl cis-trans isomerase [Bacteroidota bacterium]
MKKFLAASLVILLIAAGCVKNETKCSYTSSSITAPDAERKALQDSLTSHGIQAILSPAGFFYTINNQGNGQAVSNLCSNLSVMYKGFLLNGHIFDSTAAGNVANLQLGNVIIGWQKGVPLISKGGDITLYIPPSLGYGSNPVNDNNGNVVIPGNSNLIFTVHIEDIQ